MKLKSFISLVAAIAFPLFAGAFPAPFAFWQNPSATSGGGPTNPPPTDPGVKEWIAADTAGNTSSTQIATVGNNMSWTSATLSANQQNGLPAYVCDGVATLGTINSIGTITQAFTFFLVFQYTGATNATKMMMDGKTTSNDPGLVALATGQYRFNCANPATFGTNDNNWHILSIVVSGATSQWRMDNGGYVTTPANVGTSSVSDFAFGAAHGGSFFAAMKLGEFVLTTNTQAPVLSNWFVYEGNKWAIAH